MSKTEKLNMVHFGRNFWEIFKNKDSGFGIFRLSTFKTENFGEGAKNVNQMPPPPSPDFVNRPWFQSVVEVDSCRAYISPWLTPMKINV